MGELLSQQNYVAYCIHIMYTYVHVQVSGCTYIICRDINLLYLSPLLTFAALDVACTVFLHCGQ